MLKLNVSSELHWSTNTCMHACHAQTARARADWPSRWGEKELLHVFSLASGHMYERLLKVMVQGVLNHTAHPVKFWFLDNYASPQFKAFMPAMARKLKAAFATSATQAALAAEHSLCAVRVLGYCPDEHSPNER